MVSFNLRKTAKSQYPLISKPKMVNANTRAHTYSSVLSCNLEAAVKELKVDKCYLQDKQILHLYILVHVQGLFPVDNLDIVILSLTFIPSFWVHPVLRVYSPSRTELTMNVAPSGRSSVPDGGLLHT